MFSQLLALPFLLVSPVLKGPHWVLTRLAEAHLHQQGTILRDSPRGHTGSEHFQRIFLSSSLRGLLPIP